MSDEYLTVAEVGALLHLHIMTVYNLVKKGRLEAVRIGTRIRVPRTAVDKFLSR